MNFAAPCPEPECSGTIVAEISDWRNQDNITACCDTCQGIFQGLWFVVPLSNPEWKRIQPSQEPQPSVYSV